MTENDYFLRSFRVVFPFDEHSSFDEVKSFSDTLKSMGFNIYLTLHYSDTWADPGHQIIP